ncbi:PqqD family peptide modification chaperone [Nocardia nova]|uniref:PqqD family peptide modification chaperone n=1 Tax=Nocardia nova TaxID=37330 RepID=UPI00379989FC
MLILYAGDLHFSGWSMRGRIILREKQVPFRERRVELDWPTTETSDGVLTVGELSEEREARTGCQCLFEDLRALDSENMLTGSVAEPLPRVPILVDTDTLAVAADVVSIAEYLDEIAPDSGVRLLGSTAAERARIRSLTAWACHDLTQLIDNAPYAISLRPQPPSHLDPSAVEQAHWACETVAGLLSMYGGPYAVGGFSLVDVMLSTNFQQMAGLGIAIADVRVRDYSRRLLERESVRAHLEQARAVYRAIDEAETGSAQWILRHYRYNHVQKLLHDWQNNACVRIGNVTAERVVELAYGGASAGEIAARLAAEFNAPVEQTTIDVLTLLDRLHPTYETSALS